MKLKIEILPDKQSEEEIVIRCHALNERVLRAQSMLSAVFDKPEELALMRGNVECFVPLADILFFETQDGHVAAHTKDAMYDTPMTLTALASRLPYNFIRISKSGILNAKQVSSVARNLTGASEVTFKNTSKRTYISRAYYKAFKDRLTEIRL